MANEITVSVRLSVAKSYLKVEDDPGSLRITMSGTRSAGGSVQDIGLTEEALASVADLGTPGYVYLRNVDATNFIEVGIDNSGTLQSVVKLLPGEFALFPASTKSLYAKADTATAKLYWRMIER